MPKKAQQNNKNNCLKIPILELLEKCTEALSVADIFSNMGGSEYRTVGQSLLNYKRNGLVARVKDGKRFRYNLTPQGREQLTYLKNSNIQLNFFYQ